MDGVIQGFLLKYEESYSFLSIELLEFVQKKDQLSGLEEMGLKYVEGRNVGERIWEPFVAEGICENILGIRFEKVQKVKL